MLNFLTDENLNVTVYFQRGNDYSLFQNISPVVFSNVDNLTFTSYGDQAKPKATIKTYNPTQIV